MLGVMSTPNLGHKPCPKKDCQDLNTRYMVHAGHAALESPEGQAVQC